MQNEYNLFRSSDLDAKKVNLREDSACPMNKDPKDLEGILSKVEGMLTPNEGRYLFKLAQLNHGKGAIVEIGSWKGKSTS